MNDKSSNPHIKRPPLIYLTLPLMGYTAQTKQSDPKQII